MKSIVFILGVTLAITTACWSPAPSTPTPRYQLAVLGGTEFAAVYRLDTTTGEVHTYFMTSPQMFQQWPDQHARFQQFVEGSRLIPGPTTK
jgi:hypothetical protein